MQRKWKSSERGDAIRRFKQGESIADIALFCERTKSSVSMMLHRAGVVRNRAWTTKEMISIVRLHDDGKTDREIGRMLGRTKNAIHVRRYAMKMSGK